MSHEAGRFEIEQEYDGRYEGLDYDDVDEAARAPRPSGGDAEEEAFAEALAAAAVGSPVAAEDPFAALERAEQEYEQEHAQKKPGKRLLERLEGEEGRRVKQASGGGVGAAALLTSQKRIAAALAANERLKRAISNPQAAAAALVVAVAPPGASKTLGLGRLAACLCGASAAATCADLDKLTAPKLFKDAFLPLGKLDGMVKAALAAAEGAAAPQEEEKAARLLLTLATAPITAAALTRCGEAGKRVRKLKKESGSTAVSGAAAVVVDAWKAAIMGKDTGNKDK